MKYVARGFFILTFFFLLTSPAFAETLRVARDENVEARQELRLEMREDGKPSAARPMKLEDRQELRVENRDERQELRVESREARQEDRTEEKQLRWSEFAKKHGARLARRHAEYVERFNKLIARMQGFLDGKKADGMNTIAAQAKLDVAKKQLVDAQAQSKATLEVLNTVAVSGEADAQMGVEAMQSVQKAGTAFMNVQKTLREVVKLSKELK